MKKQISGIITLAVFAVLSFVFYTKKHLLWNELGAEKTATAAIASAPVDTVEIKLPEHKKMYDIIIDSLKVYEGTIRRNQFLADILSDYNVSYAAIDRIARDYKDVFDVRKLAANKKYTILYKQDSLKKACYFVYEPNSVDYVVFNFNDSISIEKHQKKLDTLKRSIAGVIDYSLYNTMMEQGTSPLLVNKLEEVYAWQIDFFRIQKGDKIKVIYEEISVEGTPESAS